MRFLLGLFSFMLFNFNLVAQDDTTRLFIFGHSLINHETTPSTDEVTVPHWLYTLSDHANKGIAVAGKYGFLPQHRMLPPFSQWGYDLVPPAWDSDNEVFSEANFNIILLTAGNFMQWQGPAVDYFTDPGVSPISATQDIFDWCDGEEPGLRFYIYENWPDMAPYLTNGFPPVGNEFMDYHDYTLGDFHDWWIEYQDSMLSSRPNFETKMIPVGPIISELLTVGPISMISANDLYEDDAPHGRPSIYFLASLISYMGMYAEPAPLDYVISNTIHQDIIDNYEEVVNYIWTYLIGFNDNKGNSRVFYSDHTTLADVVVEENSIEIFPNPTSGIFRINGLLSAYQIDICYANGSNYQSLNPTTSSIDIDLSSIPDGLYFVKIIHKTNQIISVQKILKQ